MDEFRTSASPDFHSPNLNQQTKFFKVLLQTHKDLKELRNMISNDSISNQSSNLSSSKEQISKVSTQQHQDLKVKFNQLIISQESQRRQYQIKLAEKGQEIEMLQNLLRSQYLKQMLLETNIKHLLKNKIKTLNISPTSSQVSQNMKNSIILGVYNRDEVGDFRRKSRDATDMRLQDMLKQPSSPRNYNQNTSQNQKFSMTARQSNANRVDKLKSSLTNLNGLKRHFGNDSKFKQDVLDI